MKPYNERFAAKGGKIAYSFLASLKDGRLTIGLANGSLEWTPELIEAADQTASDLLGSSYLKVGKCKYSRFYVVDTERAARGSK